MTPDFAAFVLAHDLVPAGDELPPLAVAAVEVLLGVGRWADVEDPAHLLVLAGAAAAAAALLPEAPPPATDAELASPGVFLATVVRRALARLAEKLEEHDRGAWVRPLDVACDVADLAESCTELAAALTVG